MTADRRLLLVHAHPDDEAIPTGVTMARYADEGVHVCLVTCTLGEEGEILADDLKHLASDAEDRLGDHRMDVLRAACHILGVDDVRILGGAGRYRDSGMMDTPTNAHPRAFWQADLDEAAGALVAVIREVRPQVVVTYDERGDYGHPDHIRAHEVTVAAFEASGDPARYPAAGALWSPQKLYYVATPKSVLELGLEYFKAAGEQVGDTFFAGVETVDDLPFGVPDDVVTTEIHAEHLAGRKLDALRAHRSQVSEDGIFFALPAEIVPAVWGVEHYTLARGAPGEQGENGRESDLFAGVGGDHEE